MTGEPEFFEIDLGAVTLRCAAYGNPSKPLLLCLHGFPEFWIGWREVMQLLAGEYRLVAPDLRGYNLSSKPAGVDAYRIKHVVADIAGLADRLSPGKPFVLCGHDWGAAAAYAFAFQHPARLTHLVIANGAHPVCFQRSIFDDPDQRRASQYINALRRPESDFWLAENDFAKTLNMLEGFSATDWMTPDLRAEYRAAWAQPGAMSAMVNWYRASPVVVPASKEPAGSSMILDLPDEAVTVRVPHLLLWGEADAALRPSLVSGLARYAPILSVKRVEGAGHWILHEKPNEVANAIRDFLGEYPARP